MYAGRADTHAGAGDRPRHGRVECPGDAEIGHERGAVDGEENVLGLDVAVDDALGVGVLNGEGHLAGDADCLAHGELGFAFEAGAKGSAGNEGHDVIQQGVMRGSGVGGSGTRGEGDGAAVEHREDVRMREARGEVDLPDESLSADDGIEVEAQDLEGDGAVVLEVVGQKDSCHAALTEFAVEAVAVTERGGEQGGEVGHAGKLMRGATSGDSIHPRPVGRGPPSRKGERTQEFPFALSNRAFHDPLRVSPCHPGL